MIATLEPGTRILFRYSGNVAEAERLGAPNIGTYHLHTAVLVRLLDESEADVEVGPMWLVRFDDGFEGAAFVDELEAVR